MNKIKKTEKKKENKDRVLTPYQGALTFLYWRTQKITTIQQSGQILILRKVSWHVKVILPKSVSITYAQILSTSIYSFLLLSSPFVSFLLLFVLLSNSLYSFLFSFLSLFCSFFFLCSFIKRKNMSLVPQYTYYCIYNASKTFIRLKL